MPTPQEHPHASARDAALHVVERLRDAGHVAYFAGGCVRDELLGLEPADFDVATDATPQRVAELFRRTRAVGAHFGVMLVRERKAETEVATFRADGSYTDARRPDSVRFATPEEDAARRDFTINALFLDPLETDPDRRVIDFVGGRADLNARVLRAVGVPDERLAEDHLRALRAARFAARFDLTIAPTTADAVRRHAAELRGVSVERIGIEIRKMMAHPSRARGAALVEQLSLDTAVFGTPSVRPIEARQRVIADLPPGADGPLGLAAWAVERCGEEALAQADDLARDWAACIDLSNDERATLAGTLRSAGLLRSGFLSWSVAQQKRLAASDHAGRGLHLLRAIDPEAGHAAGERIGALMFDGIGVAPTPFVDGGDLIDMEYTPGPMFRRVLDAVYDAQLEGRVGDREAALALAATLADAIAAENTGETA